VLDLSGSASTWVAVGVSLAAGGAIYNEASVLAGTDDGGGNNDLTFRQVIPSSQLAPGAGANAANCSGAAATLVSDWVNLPESFDATKPFVIAFASIASGNFHSSVAALTNAALWFTTGSDDGTQVASGYVSEGAFAALVTKIEIQGVAAAPFVPNNFWQQLGPALAQ
jgi:hypothetical protein